MKEVMMLIKLKTLITSICYVHLHLTIQNLHLRNTSKTSTHEHHTHWLVHLKLARITHKCLRLIQLNLKHISDSHHIPVHLNLKFLMIKALSHYIMYACQQILLVDIINLYNTFSALFCITLGSAMVLL